MFNATFNNISVVIVKEKLEDTKGVIRGLKSKNKWEKRTKGGCSE
jgi:hypothetical protein